MLKSFLILFVFILFVATMKPTPVEQIKEVNRVYCQDICE